MPGKTVGNSKPLEEMSASPSFIIKSSLYLYVCGFGSSSWENANMVRFVGPYLVVPTFLELVRETLLKTNLLVRRCLFLKP